MGRSGHRDERLLAARRRLTDAGATLVEYALVISLLVVVSIPASQYLIDGSRDQVNNEADCVSRRPPPPDCQIPTVPAPEPPDPGPGDPPDDGPPLPPPGGAAWGSGTPRTHPDGRWGFTQEITVRNDDGPIPDAYVIVRVDIISPAGESFHLPCTTGPTGSCTISYDTTAPGITRIRLTIDQVNSDPETTEMPEYTEWFI